MITCMSPSLRVAHRLITWLAILSLPVAVWGIFSDSDGAPKAAIGVFFATLLGLMLIDLGGSSWWRLLLELVAVTAGALLAFVAVLALIGA